MKEIYQELADRIRGEVPDLAHLVQRTQQRRSDSKTNPAQQDVYLESVALNLHSFYSGLERLFELIARHVDRSKPSGETWHRELLNHMASDIPDARPAVISAETADNVGRVSPVFGIWFVTFTPLTSFQKRWRT